MLWPSGFIGIDWSGARGPHQTGIQVALARPGRDAPTRVCPPASENWGREAIRDWLIDMAAATPLGRPILVGIDFAFAHPFIDRHAYFPGLQDAPITPAALWQLIDEVCCDEPHLYGGGFFLEAGFGEYYLSPRNPRAPRFASRRRVTEIAARKAGRSPSLTFKAIGADNVATGSMAGMRLIHTLKADLTQRLAVWPFDSVKKEGVLNLSMILVEIFPSFYFHAVGMDPARNAAANPAFLSRALAAYDSGGVHDGFKPRGKDADEADALISAAALRYFSDRHDCWKTHAAASQEGWIFGVPVDPKVAIG